MKKFYNLTLAIAFSLFFGAVLWSQTTFNFTGSMQTYIVPAGVTSVQIEAFGAEGGSTPVGFGYGGLGGYVSGEFTVTPGETLNIFVGGQGAEAQTGGFNGGGNGVSSPGGGGASDVRQLGSTLNDRIIVAGGGGGGAYETAWSSGWGQGVGTGDGGDGGGLTGANGLAWQNACQGGTGGTQVAGGAGGGTLGVGGNGAGSPGDTGGGGGGYYGGGGGGDCTGYNGAGGGGSGYTSPGAVAVVHTAGFQNGNGQVIITPLCIGLNTTVSATDVCDGDLVTLSALSTSGGNITWDNGVVDGVPFAPPIGTTTYTATSSNPGDCGFTVDITVNALPTVDGGGDINLCNEGSSVTLSGTGNADIYTWDNGVSDGVAFIPPVGSNTYVLTGTNTTTGCSNTDTVEVNVATTMTVFGNTQDEMLGNDGSIDINVTGGAPPLTYLWDNGAGTSEDPSGLSAGDYTCVITDAFGCTVTVGYTIYSQVELGEMNKDYSIYPNPTTGEINIIFPGDYHYYVHNGLGQKVISGRGSENQNLDLSSFETGIYTIKIMSGAEIYFARIVKK